MLAIPNLMTLGIVLGRGNAAHAGERILDVEAPAFRGASLAGALIALAMAAFVGYLIASRERARESDPRRRLDAAGERVAGVGAAALDPANEPALPLLGGAVRPGLGIDASLRLLLDAVVTHRGRGGETVLDVLARDLHDQSRSHRVRHPDARIAVRLQLDANRVRLRARVSALRPAQDAGQILDVVPVLVREDVRLGEWALLRRRSCDCSCSKKPRSMYTLPVRRAVERARLRSSPGRSRSTLRR